MRRLLSLAGVASLVCACGSSNGSNNNGGSNPPALRTFSYGAPAAPSAAQSSTATVAQTRLVSVAGAGGQRSTPEAAPALADQLAAQLPLSGTLMAPVPGPEALRALESAAAVASGRSAALDTTTCATTTATSITFRNCTYSESGFNGTLNGSIQMTSTSATWDITYGASGTSGNTTFNMSFHWSGQVSWTQTTLQGFGRSEATGSSSSAGQSDSYSYTAGWDANLTLQNGCITSGTLEIRRTVSSQTASQNALHDAAWKFTWTGCNQVQVATGH